ncbi:Purple acid phosphatase 15 [Stylosanthes scabra]|uniref:Purple acid phosphatase 15 n=1 Tax=Stylosanthes scabra TaxID=79078 RepID=A0ABU6WSF9_9FABA|nr:Purple acid phosphatase 15 [Stylosanthes scabra]
MGWVCVPLIIVVVGVLVVNGGGVPTTLEGPFKAVTVPLDNTFRGNAVDLPDTDPLVQRTVEGFQPEQISVSLSSSYHSVWISWITGEFQIGENIKALDPESVGSIIEYGRFRRRMSQRSKGYSLVYNQLYPFEGLQNYTSGIIHHVRLTGIIQFVCISFSVIFYVFTSHKHIQ